MVEIDNVQRGKTGAENADAGADGGAGGFRANNIPAHDFHRLERGINLVGLRAGLMLDHVVTDKVIRSSGATGGDLIVEFPNIGSDRIFGHGIAGAIDDNPRGNAGAIDALRIGPEARGDRIDLGGILRDGFRREVRDREIAAGQHQQPEGRGEGGKKSARVKEGSLMHLFYR